MPKTALTIGPTDQGRRMSLAEFKTAEGQAGHLYELNRGVISVVDIPNRRHLAQVNAIKRQVHAYDAAHPDRIHTIATGSECKILLLDQETERHPDLAIYKTAPPEGDDFWAIWIPEIVIEVISPGSEHRDYQEKRDDYLRFGVGEYWILDANRQEMLVLHRRRGRWVEEILGAVQQYRTKVLPGFEFSCTPVFLAADAAGPS